MKGSISEAITRILSPDAGKQASLTEADKQFIEKYQKETAAIPAETQVLRFANVIRNEGQCGFAMAGSVQYLVNTDTGRRYRVTVRTSWTQGIESGQYDTIYISEAGGKQHLGCTDSGSIPVAYYSRSVVGEVPI